MEWIIISLSLLGCMAISFMFLYSTEKADREKFEKLMKHYKKLANESMDKLDTVINLSDALNEENVDLREREDELTEALDEQDQKLLEKEKRIEELEKYNEKLCEQIRQIFHDRPISEGE